MKEKNLWATLVAIAGNVIFGLSFLFSKRALNIEGMTPVILLAYRFAIAFVTMNLILIFYRKGFCLKGKNIKPLIMLGLVQPVLYFIFEDYGLLHSTTTFASVMMALIPIVAIALGVIFMKELPTLGQLLFCMLSMAGVITLTLIQSGSGSLDALGIILISGAVLAGSAFYMLSSKCSKEFTAFERTYVMFAEGSVFFIILALIQNKGSFSALAIWSYSGGFILSALYLGILSSVVAFLALNYVTSYLSVSRSTAFANVTTVVSTVAGILLLKEPCNTITVASIIVIIVGVVGVQRMDKRQ